MYICKHFNSFTLVNIAGTLVYLKTRQFVVQYSNGKSHVIGQAIQIPVWYSDDITLVNIAGTLEYTILNKIVRYSSRGLNTEHKKLD